MKLMFIHVLKIDARYVGMVKEKI